MADLETATLPAAMEDQLTASSSDSPQSESDSELQLTVHHHGKPLTFYFPWDATITDLSDTVADTLSIPPSHQKYMVTPRVGILKPPFKDPVLSLSSLISKKTTLMGSTLAEVASLDAAVSHSLSRASRRHGRLSAKHNPRRDWKRQQEESIYTFTTLRPLQYLPNPSRSLAFLERLRADPGIKAVMRGHRWSVPLLTEMDPAAHTTHDSRTLGLNRNRGEVIELRLRTDAYDGYRDYKTIRKTLCHELTHNVHGEHDADFWALCRQVEREVDRADWKSGGHRLGEQEFFEPGADTDEHVDGGGWTGGEFVLGGDGATNSHGGVVRSADGVSGVLGGGQPLSRREILARAAEERARRQKSIGKGPGGEGAESGGQGRS